MDRSEGRTGPLTEVASQELCHLVSSVSHHLINAFSTVVSHLELVRMGALPAGELDTNQLIDSIIQTSLDASGTARRLTEHARGYVSEGFQPVRLDNLAREMVEAMRGRFPEVTWELAIEEVPAIPGRADQLRLLMIRLMENAAEAVGAGRGTVTVGTGRDQRGWVVLTVSDDGPGMAPEVRQRCTEPFYSTRSGHAGIGLSVAQSIWRRHNGALAISSEPGQGTRITLSAAPEA